MKLPTRFASTHIDSHVLSLGRSVVSFWISVLAMSAPLKLHSVAASSFETFPFPSTKQYALSVLQSSKPSGHGRGSTKTIRQS